MQDPQRLRPVLVGTRSYGLDCTHALGCRVGDLPRGGARFSRCALSRPTNLEPMQFAGTVTYGNFLR